MRGSRKWMWAVFAAAATTTPVVAQTSSSSTFSGSTGSSGATSTGGSSLSGTSSSGSGMGGGGGGNGLGGSQQGGTSLQTMQQAPSLSPPSGNATTSLSSTNFLSGYYANPYSQGLISATVNAAPGGFGMTLYGNSSSSSNGTGSVNRGTGGVNNQNMNQISGILIPIQTQINYTAQAHFATTPVSGTRLQADLREAIDGSISNPKGVQVITDANNNVVLRGSAKDDEESRLIEGLVRITPGVRAITNELTVSAPAAGVAAANK